MTPKQKQMVEAAAVTHQIDNPNFCGVSIAEHKAFMSGAAYGIELERARSAKLVVEARAIIKDIVLVLESSHSDITDIAQYTNEIYELKQALAAYEKGEET